MSDSSSASFRQILEAGIREALYQLGPTKWDATRSIAYRDAQTSLRSLRKIYLQVYAADRKRLNDIEGFKRWHHVGLLGGVFDYCTLHQSHFEPWGWDRDEKRKLIDALNARLHLEWARNLLKRL